MTGRVEMRVGQESLFHLMEQMMSGKIVIPSFQRDYVWTRQQIEEMVDSLLHKYPLGVMTFIGSRGLPPIEMKQLFITDEGRELAHAHIAARGITPDYEIVLDGAQRLQTIYKLLVTGEFQVLYDPLSEHWKLCSEEDLAGGDCWPYVSTTTAYNSYCMSTGLREHQPYWPDIEKISTVLARNPLAMPDKILVRDARTRGHATTIWRARFEEKLLRETGGEELLDKYVAGRRAKLNSTKIPDTLKGPSYTDKEKRDRRALIAKATKTLAAESAAIEAEYGAVFEVLRCRKTMIESYMERIDEFESALTRHMIPINRFSIGRNGTLGEAVRIFKRLNTAGVPVDTDFLDDLARRTEGE